MNYKKIYDEIINRAKSRVLLEGIYTENHHIIPRCMSGSDDKNNRVDLPAREHCLVHLLLIKIYPGVKELVFAANMMYRLHRSCRRYAWLRERFSKLMREEMKGRTFTAQQLLNMKISHLGQKSWNKGRKGIYSEQTRKQISDTLKKRIIPDQERQNFLKVINSPEYRKNQSDAHKGHVHTDEHKRKIKENHKGMSGRKHSIESKRKMSETRKRNLKNIKKYS